jgi:hypothetical protein
MATRISSWSPDRDHLRDSEPRVASARDSHGPKTPPREVWPLLATIGTTLIVMMVVIFWHAAPAVAGGVL